MYVFQVLPDKSEKIYLIDGYSIRLLNLFIN